MTLPLILVIGGLVLWPAAYAIHLSTLNRRMNTLHRAGQFRDPAGFRHLLERHLPVGVLCHHGGDREGVIGFWLAHMLHHIPTRGSASGAACCWCPG
jgi:multiple sugar transport system permease protein